MKLCGRIIIFLAKFMRKNVKFEEARVCLKLTAVGKPMIALIGRFLLSITVPELNVYSSAAFTEGRPICTQILPGQGRPPAAIFGIRKLETMGYATVKTASLCVPSF